MVPDFATRTLRIPHWALGDKTVLIGMREVDDEYLRIRIALLVYATYRLRNSVAHRLPFRSSLPLLRLLRPPWLGSVRRIRVEPLQEGPGGYRI